MDQSVFGRWIGLLRKKQPVSAPLVPPDEAPPQRSVELLWTGPGLGRTEGA
ncbi:MULTISPECIES: hypothetical protein [unclassified Mycobacterium]|uniref:hypothetical protein n=1 Tax=unclassified Mycobacterium TaxID=2642494 RepID=UPI000A8C831E|nr:MULTISPECIES: hypothetical protein [unclassified Mycobacterium]